MSAPRRPPSTSTRRSRGGASADDERRAAQPAGESVLVVSALRACITEADVLDLAVALSAWRSMVTVHLSAGGVRLSWSKTLRSSARADQPGLVAACRCLSRDRTGAHPHRRLGTDGPGAGGRQLGARRSESLAARSWVWMSRCKRWPLRSTSTSRLRVASRARGRITGGRGASSSRGHWLATSCQTSCPCASRRSRPSCGTSCASP